MNPLPDSLPLLDDKLGTCAVLTRQRPHESPDEATFESLLTRHLDVVAGALSSAGILAANARLEFLAQQLGHGAAGRSDLILGEIVSNRLHRLVVVEVKLARNAEIRREVLTQVFDYAGALRRPTSAVVQKLYGAAKAWVDDQRALEQLMRSGETLLLVCGDEIHHGLVERARAILDDNVLARFKVAFLSLALYRGGTTTLLIPNVVGAITEAKRELHIQLKVSGENGRELPLGEASVREPEPTVPRRARPVRVRMDRVQFLAEVARSAATWEEPLRTLIDALEGGKLQGLSLRWDSGSGFFVESAGSELAWLDAGGAVQVKEAMLIAALGVTEAQTSLAELTRRCGVALVRENQAWVQLGEGSSRLDLGRPELFAALYEWLRETHGALTR